MDSHGPHPTNVPSTPTRQKGELSKYLKQLSEEHNLNLPWDDSESPSKRPRSPAHDVAQEIAFLFFQNFPGLNTAVEEFKAWGPTLASDDDKLSFLFDRLRIEKTNCFKRRTLRSRSLGRSAARQSAHLPEPRSPTLSIKQAPKANVEMPADDFQLPSASKMRKPSLKRPRSDISLTDKPRGPSLGKQQSRRPEVADTSTWLLGPARDQASRAVEAVQPELPLFGDMPPPKNTTTSSQRPGIKSADVSFTSNGLSSTQASFSWSEAHDGTQEPGSPATSAGDEYHTPAGKNTDVSYSGANNLAMPRCTPDSDYGDISSSSLNRAHLSFVEQGEPSALAAATGGAHDPELGSCATQETDYGDFTALMDAIQGEHSSNMDWMPTSYGQLASPADTVDLQESHRLTGQARVERIVPDGLSGLFLPPCFRRLPFELRWEAARVLQTKRITMRQLWMQWGSKRTVDTLYALVKRFRIPFTIGSKLDGSTSFVANLRWSKSPTGRMFDLEYLPPKTEKSNSLERKFGRDRFLYIDVPSLSKGPEGTDINDYIDGIEDRVLSMLRREQDLLGRSWRQFHVQSKKSTRAGDPDFARAGAHQFFFFATDSTAAEPDNWSSREIMEVWEWAVPFLPNRNMPVPKAFARMDLVASRTTSAYRLSKHEIVYDVGDLMPTNDPDDTTFDEEGLDSNDMRKSDSPMNDGCQKIATWLMVQIQKALNLDYLPSAVQGRICGAKGVWYRDDASPLSKQKPDKLLWIGNSQIKVRQHAESFVSDDEKMTFNIVRVSGPGRPSQGYADILRIMAERHVPQSAIMDQAKAGMEAKIKPFLDGFDDPRAMRHWMHCQNVFREERNRETGIDTVGGFPVSREEHINFLLESDFEPKTCQYLAGEIQDAAKQVLDDAQTHMRVEIPCSTMPLGVADETGEVEPGDVHWISSEPFRDSCGVPMILSGRHALVSRLPALGPSDVQKMRIVQKESLAHLVDVLVFSSKGPRSQASKMQGGDYDGDTFWTCWEPSLVEHFRNVPVRFIESKPTDFGIQTNTETLDQIINPDARGRVCERDTLALISKGTQARMRYDQLGTITLALEKLTYEEDGFDSEGAGVLFQVHGHMIDSDKQGYTLPAQKWDRMKLSYKVDSKPTPVYRRLMQGESIESLKPKAGNIVDRVFFEVVAPAIQHAKSAAEENAKYALARDRDLDRDFPAKLATYKGRAGHGKLLALLSKVEDLKLTWKTYMDEYRSKPHGKGEAWRQYVERIREEFDSIMPEDADSEPAYTWLNSKTLDLSQWGLIKASALVHQKASPKLMFSAAGAELCAIKKNANGSVRSMTGNAYMWHRPTRVRKKKTDVDAEIDGEDAEMSGTVGSG